MRAEPGGFRQDLRWRVGALVFGVLLLVGAACTAWTLRELRASGAQAASQDGRAIAESVAQTLAQQFGRAVRLGIPLAELPGVPPYLEATLQRQPVLASIAVLQPDGGALYAVGQKTPGREGSPVQVEIAAAGAAAPAGFVRVDAEAAASLRGGLARALWIAALAVLGLALAAALAAALGPGARLEAQRRLALERLRHPQAGDAPVPEGAAEGPQAVLEALAHGDAQQRAARTALQAYAQELLAMDFDGRLRAPIERILRQATPASGDG